MSIKQRWYKFKPLPEDIQERISGLSNFFETEGVSLAYLFGSLVCGKGNDVDLALFVDKEDLADLREKTGEVLNTQRLDLVNLKAASPMLCFNIISTGTLVYKKNDEIENAFESAVIQEYKDTTYLRKKQALNLKERMRGMVLKPEIILERLKELDTVMTELAHYRDKTKAEIEASLSLRWTIERGLIAAANLIFDIADHILSGYFGVYAETYEDSLRLLGAKGVISEKLYQKLKGLGGFRNILVHEYLKVDISEVQKYLLKGFDIFPAYCIEIQPWLETTKG